jgi:WD40 repeat protein/serine/threonine protein kinase
MPGDEFDNDATILSDAVKSTDQLSDTECFADLSTSTGIPITASANNSFTTVIPESEAKNQRNLNAVAAEQVQPGDQRRFRILRPHAQGGLGNVSVAKDLELNREVAFKEIRVQYADDNAARARFLLEAEVTGGLEHPSIVPVYAMGRFADGRPYYAMRFIKGQSLQEVVDQYHLASAAVSSEERSVELRGLLQRFIAVCQAIEYAHSRGIIHRDIKPANIMLGSYGETLVVDWGLAKPLGREESSPEIHPSSEAPATGWLLPASGSSVEPTRMGSASGTLQFMGPEQAAGRIDLIGPPADIYSLGATLYYILTGRTSVSGKNIGDVFKAIQSGNIAPPSSVVPSIPKSLDAVCLKAMALQPSDRYDSAMAMARDLERWLADEPVSVYPESGYDRMARWLRRNKSWFRAVTLAAITVILVLSIAVVLINRQRNVADQQREIAVILAKEKSDLAQTETELRKKAQWQAASRSFEQSVMRCEQLDPTEGILSLTRNLVEATAIGADDLEYSIRAQLGRWKGKLNTLEETVICNDAIRGLVLSPDGKNMLVATNGPAMLMSQNSGKVIGAPLTHDQRVTSMIFCSKSNRFITASEDQTIRFWDSNTCELLGDPISLDDTVVSLALSSDERVLATASGSTIRFMNVDSRAFDERTLTHSSALTMVAFCPGSPLLLAGDWEGQVSVWNTETGQLDGTPWEHGSAVLGVTVSPDGKTAATCELNHQARLWEIETGKQVGSSLMHSGMVGHVSFSSDGRQLVTGCADQVARVWDVTTGRLIGSALHHSSIVNVAIFSADDDFIWTGCGDQGLRRWKVADDLSTSLPLSKNGNVIGAKFDDASETLVTVVGAIVAGSYVLPGELRSSKISTGSIARDPIGSNLWLEVVAFSLDGKLFATAAGERSVQVWNVESGEPSSTAIELSSAPKCIAFSNDRSMLLIGTEAGDVHIVNLATGKNVIAPIQLGQRISAVSFFPDNNRFIVGGWDQKVRVYSISLGLDAKPIEFSQESLITSVGVEPAGTMYFTCTANGSIRLWDANTHTQIGPVMKYGSRVKIAIFTPDGKTIFASYFDGSTRQWDVRSHAEIGPPLWQSKEIMALDISSDAEWLGTASADWTLKLWKVGLARGTPEIVQRRYERLTNMQRLEDGSLNVLTIPQWRARQ